MYYEPTVWLIKNYYYKGFIVEIQKTKEIQ